MLWKRLARPRTIAGRASDRATGDEHARLLENDRGMQFKAIDAFYSAERRLEELERSGVDAEVVSPMPPLLDYALSGPEGLELSRRVNEFIASLCGGRPATA